MEHAPVKVNKQRWVEVKKVGKKIKVDLDQLCEESAMRLKDRLEVSSKDKTQMFYRAPFHSEWWTAESATLNDDLYLNKE